MKRADDKNILRGVSTLDAMKKNFKAILFLIIVTALGVDVFGGHSTLDIVDPTFNPQVVANLYGSKTVDYLESLPDGKILAFGKFNSYNSVPTGQLVRLNADGSLDTTFNTQTVTSSGNCDLRTRILIQPDGKFIVPCKEMVANGQAPKNLLRFNADGTLDTSFNYTLGSQIFGIALDSLGRLTVQGSFSTPQGSRPVVRLNADGSLDNSFNYTPPQSFSASRLTMQGSRLIVGGGGSSTGRILRLNENGSEDTSFVLSPTGGSIAHLLVQPDNKILYLKSNGIFRLNENGGNDSSFQTSSILDAQVIKLAADGKMVLTSWSSTATFRRFLANGGEDPSFNPYTTMASAQGTFAIQPDGSVIIGDYFTRTTTHGINNFVRLTPGGVPDPTFNPGGVAFQTILPGSIRAIEPLPDGKVFLGGKFDLINDITRPKIARLNADATVDTTFQINMSGNGNYFSLFTDVYHIRAQANGKIVVSGWFDYVLNGAVKRNLVRLNADGSIDDTFNLTETINDWSEVVGAGRNRLITYSDGKVMVGISKLNGFGPTGPLKLTAGGARDTSFISMLNSQSPHVFIDDVALQPDGKILVGGSHDPDSSGHRSYVARLNADGSPDSTFPYIEEPGRWKRTLWLLPSGKILVGKYFGGTAPGRVERLNSDGSPDASFTALSLPAGIINALLVLPNGKIFVGGKFTLTVNGQPAKNLLQLGADGNFEPTVYNLNEEVLALAADSEGRVLVGGGFTVIGADGGQGASRSYVARLTDWNNRFDYDGDGRSDISVFRPAENKWYILQSSDSQVVQTVFAMAGDVPVPSDYDGDGKTDLAVFRPSTGDWWYLSSISGAQVNVNWGQAGDIPRPSDFDGDGKTDFVVYRPSNSVWYRMGSTGATSIIAFGIAEDKPLIGDFDGDGKSDPAVFRPSTGDWWYAASASGGQFIPVHWGQTGDIPVPADYDADGKTDFVVYRPSNGGWYILRSGEQNYTILQFGSSEDKPVAADFDGDGKADVAVWRPSTGTWYLLQTTAGFGAVQWGTIGDVPTENAFLP